ncbi:MAG: 3-phosphoshikimate 1-carboxyvinyltransferase [Candidatus Dormibacteria bacterium]
MSPGAAPTSTPLRGRCRVPGDKAISHRAALLALRARGRTRIRGFSPAGDCAATLEVVRRLGAQMHGAPAGVLEITPGTPRPGTTALDCGRSGTTMRLTAGLVAPDPGVVELSGAAQLLRRPMERVAAPLRLMGAWVQTAPGGLPPLRIEGGRLRGISYLPEVASAQVKSAMLLAGLGAEGPTSVSETVPTRDHTERLLQAMGADLEVRDGAQGRTATVRPGSELLPLHLEVPADASSAAVLAAAAALVPGSDVVLEQVSVNPGRTGFLEVLREMGAEVDIEPRSPDSAPEPWADVRVRHAPLKALRIERDQVPALIDELPLLGLLATCAEGESLVRGASELRVKESDRIAGLVRGLQALGADCEELPDGFVVRGPTRLGGGVCDAMGDHRLAMAFHLAGLRSQGKVHVLGLEFADDSFPGFLTRLGGLM